MTDRETTLVTGRVKRIETILGRLLNGSETSPGPPLEERERRHLREAAEELYWNDLEWEKLTGEERLDQEFLTELAFPGFLAFVRGLVLTEAMPDALAPPRPAPEVVDELLLFLAGRVVELGERSDEADDPEEREHRRAELQLTSRLLDLTLYIRYGLDAEEVERVEAALSAAAS